MFYGFIFNRNHMTPCETVSLLSTYFKKMAVFRVKSSENSRFFLGRYCYLSEGRFYLLFIIAFMSSNSSIASSVMRSRV